MTFFPEIPESDPGPVLWDADPDVCCAAFQLGACSHTEHEGEPKGDEDGRYVLKAEPGRYPTVTTVQAPPIDEEPF